MRTVAFCETDEFCQRVLARHWPGIPIYGDIRGLDGGTVGCDVVTGGFPCQPFSVAGKQRGKEDDRHLWPEMFRVIAQARPAWVIGENVPGIIRMELDQVLSDLEGIGYSTRTFVIPACAADAPHRRDRVWIVAHAENKRQQRSGITRPGRDGLEDSSQVLAHTKRRRQQGSWESQHAGDQAKGRKRKATEPVNGGEPRIWPAEPNVGRVVARFSSGLDSPRLQALGNAVVPQVVEIIGKAIMTCSK